MLKLIMERVFPADTEISWLPYHGAEGVLHSIKESIRVMPDEADRTVIHSWAEFDGCMYYLQNEANALCDTVLYFKEEMKLPSVHAIYVNHWRTAENRIILGAFGACAITPAPAESYYESFAAANGIPKKQFSEAMHGFAEMNADMRERLNNDGFCYLGCWLAPMRTVESIRFADRESYEFYKKGYTSLCSLLERCLPEATQSAGVFYLRFLQNRAECSLFQLEALNALLKIKTDAKTDTERRDLCKRAEEFANAYMKKHMEFMPDRGCQGTLMSYLCTVPVFIKHVEHCILGGEECKCNPPANNQIVAPF